MVTVQITKSYQNGYDVKIVGVANEDPSKRREYSGNLPVARKELAEYVVDLIIDSWEKEDEVTYR